MTGPADGSDDLSAFPPSSVALAEGRADEHDAVAFLVAFERWRPSASAWLTRQARRGAISEQLAQLLEWTLGDADGDVAVRTPYPVERLPEATGSALERAVDVLVWRSGLVDFLADVWDVLGPPAFELEECTTVIDDLLTPTVLRGILACPDCLRTFTDDHDLAAHPISCPIRLRRIQGRR